MDCSLCNEDRAQGDGFYPDLCEPCAHLMWEGDIPGKCDDCGKPVWSPDDDHCKDCVGVTRCIIPGCADEATGDSEQFNDPRICQDCNREGSIFGGEFVGVGL